MKLFVGLDVSLEKTAICVISEHGEIVREAQAASEPEALARWIGTWRPPSPSSVLKPAPCRNGCIVA